MVPLIALGLLGSRGASAALMYNYAQDWLYDSTSGLYWQVAPIPTSTFVPSADAVATDQQLDQLGTDAGLTGFTYSVSETSAPYSQTLANLLAFFQSDAPARSAQSQSNLSLSGLYFYTGDVQYGPDDFEYQVFSYRASADSSLWNYVSTTTLGTYGPGNPCPAGVSGGTCPAFEAGFVVSSVQPVPLPNSAGLTVLGLSVLAGCLRRRPAPSEARSGLQFPWACW
jgi:hypothetical protein